LVATYGFPKAKKNQKADKSESFGGLFEAFVGALFIDQGIDAVSEF